MSRPPSILYIGGSGRSGSTLVARLLAEVPGIVAVGEVRYVLDRGIRLNHLCGCGLPFRDCQFWTDVFDRALPERTDKTLDEIAALAQRIDRNRFIPALASPRLRTRQFQTRLDRYGSYLSALYGAIAEVSGGSVLLDSSKDPSYAFVLRALMPFDLTLLHLVRDSRAVAFSWTREKLRPEVHDEVAHMAKRSPLRSSFHWFGYNLVFTLLSRTQTRYRRTRYEDFVSGPDQVGTLAEWLGLATGDVSLKNARPVHDISGNPLRFDTQPLQVVADDEWRLRMKSSDRRIVTIVTAPLLALYGYLGRPR